MKIVFVGPSLWDVDWEEPGIVACPPAGQGDIMRAVLSGASAIGLIDGQFEQSASVWHKEILFALSRGLPVLGAASLGALRAAECAPFGMEPVGVIARAYCSGEIFDDDAVALVHAPQELGFQPLTEALVDIRPTLAALSDLGIVDPQTAKRLFDTAKSLFFKDRTLDAISQALPQVQRETFVAAYRAHRISQKTLDARELICRILTATAPAETATWCLNEPKTWRDALGETAPFPFRG